MPTTFELMQERARREGIQGLTKDSIKWFRQNAKKMVEINSSSLIREDPGLLVNSMSQLKLGTFAFAMYSPKHKKTLPYYDQFPLLLPLDIRKTMSRNEPRLLALNLHYLNPESRAFLLGKLLDTLNNERMDDTTKMLTTYGTLKAASNIYKPALKSYIPNHFRSKFMRIPAKDWMTAVFLPVESFVGSSKQKVWGESTAITGRKRLR